jgi:hypothetical protein
MKNLKRFTCTFFVFLMLFTMTSMVAAAEATEALDQSAELEMHLVDGTATSGDCAQPHGWGGVAPQVTKIELYDYGPWNDGSGRFFITLKVTGYGRGTAFFDGKPVDEDKYMHFINSGTTADGFYHRYLIGPVYEAGVYDFSVTIKSIATPYSELPFFASFRFD